jgi:amidase
MIKRILVGVALVALSATTAMASVAPPPTTEQAAATIAAMGPIENFSLFQLADGIDDGAFNSEAIVMAYLQRIADIDDSGPGINSIIATFPDALDQARRLDAEIKAGQYRGPLHGLPILLKDNIEAKGALPTTAGSLALKDNVTGRDAPLVARLRDAGAVILGKTNLSEWANIRSSGSTSGWSAIGGLTKNPHALDRNTCGSSAGSGAAMAASLAAATVGTETDGSIVCPSSVNGIVGFKPTVGLVSRRFVVPISHTQDTAGPMTRTVFDAAIMLDAMAGSDPEDPATRDADKWRTNYANYLNGDGLAGVRIGVLHDRLGNDPALIALFNQAVAKLQAAGAIIVDIADSKSGIEGIGDDEETILYGELKYDMAAYLQGLPQGLVPHKTLADLIAFNKVNAETELKYFDQSGFERAESVTMSQQELEQLAQRMVARANGHITALLARHKVALLVQPTTGPAWLSTLGKGDAFDGPSASSLAAVAGAPHLTVPMGALNGLPVGVSFTGARWDDHAVLKAGHAYEKESKARVTPTYIGSIKSQ